MKDKEQAQPTEDFCAANDALRALPEDPETAFRRAAAGRAVIVEDLKIVPVGPVSDYETVD